MKHGRVLAIKNPKLRIIRNNLREIIIAAKSREWYRLSDEDSRIENNIKKSKVEISDSEMKILQGINHEKEKLNRWIKDSICECGHCGEYKTDMVYHTGWRGWWCLKCFKQEEENCDPKNFFNKGVIVNKNAEKPCHVLRWCPYGGLVESFRIRTTNSKYTCQLFDHDCPVFYVSEQFTEDSLFEPPINDKLQDNLKNCKFFNNERIIARKIVKPCHLLNWCPYGSLGDGFFKRELEYKYGCKIFPHDCPVFYHSEPLKERM